MRRLRQSQYGAYLQTGEWTRQRRLAIKRARERCARCGKTSGELDVFCREKVRLEVHHITYDRLGYEEPDDVIVLCHRCHDTLHDRNLLYWDPESLRKYLPEEADAA